MKFTLTQDVAGCILIGATAVAVIGAAVLLLGLWRHWVKQYWVAQ